MQNRALVFIAHPLRGDVQGNLRSAAEWVRWAALEARVCPVAPYFSLIRALNESTSYERELGILIGHRVLTRCDELWLCGDRVSKGMRREVVAARERGLTIVNLTDKDWI